MIKSIIKNIPGIKKVYNAIKFSNEFSYDKKFFLKNYSHSKETKNKIGYNMLLISHSLEKGMSNKNPRRFGVAKTKELLDLIEKYKAFGEYKKDFAFVNAINALRGYVKFYKEKGWGDANECKRVSDALAVYENIEKMNVGNFTLSKKDFEKDAYIDYEKFLLSRHSVREFQKKNVSKEDLEKAINMAILSPSACNRQMCKVYYVSNEDKKEKIIHMAQGFGGFEVDTINTIIVTFDVNANYFIGERNQGWFNAGLFSMNLVNAMHSLGIGSCFCQFGNTVKQEEKLKSIIGIPSNERIAVIIACGYYVDECIIPYSPRKEINDIFKEV